MKAIVVHRLNLFTLFALIACGCLCLIPSTAANMPGVTMVWHVSPTGSDSAAGTSTAPFATLAKAASVVHPGDVVMVADGVYRETLVPLRSGKKGKPITFVAAPGAHPVVTGCDQVSGWKQTAGGKWEALVSWDLGIGRNQMFWNGKPLVEARQPNQTGTNLMKPDLAKISISNEFTLRSAAFSSDTPNCWAGALFWGHGWEAWSYQCAFVKHSTSNSVTIRPATISKPWFHELPDNATESSRPGEILQGGILMGLETMLDAPGEWCWHGKTIHLIPPGTGGDPNQAVVEARHRTWVVNLDGINGIVIRGLRFVAGGIRVKGDDNCLEDCESRYGSHFYVYSNGFAPDGGREDGTAVIIDGQKNVISNCVVSATAGGGIGLAGNGNIATRCLVEDVDYAGVYGAGISLSGKNHGVIFNTIRRIGRDGILLMAGKKGSTAGCRIFLNDVSFPGQMCKDCGIIYTWGNNGHPEGEAQTRIAYNWLHDNLALGPAGPGVYLDNYTRNFLVDHNVIWDCLNDSGVRLNGPALGHQIFNNTLFNTLDIGLGVYNQFPDYNPAPDFWVRRDMYNYDARNNLSLGEDAAKFLNSPDTKDFALKLKFPGGRKNPAIASGQYISGIAQTLNGKAPDRGAYQTGQPRWTAGRDGQADAELLSTLKVNQIINQ